jgi:pyrimidine operon attenuation protein / uracil phosphoribosyltransferase
MSGTKNYILNQADIERKIERLAYEIAEQNAGTESIILAGIAPHGQVLTRKLARWLEQITSLHISQTVIHLDKKHPATVQVEPEMDFNGKTIIIADDVSMTGKTMMYALKPLLESHPAKIQTLVLVERQQKKFPMHSDYVGQYVSTTLQELIIVEADAGELTGAYLV